MKDSTKSSVQSNQEDVHEDLEALVTKHIRHSWSEPTPDHSRLAASDIARLLEDHNGPLILDSFCGTGMSTARLAEERPDALVIGIDKSRARLSRHKPNACKNYHLIRASCEHVWSELASAGVTCERHYLLYPNPWPKKAHLKRRIHGHPSFPLLASLGGVLEMRSNWLVYIEEFAKATALIGFESMITPVNVTSPLTLFEQKYNANNEVLWRCTAAPKTIN